ncbi:hypothetical protein PTSG_08993 [Salpingoeca rosetta]|uniref:Transcription elongation factor 1 homolog n=1 Tax=Salpingoeca rosetta (strain ATCC 50818 / BSB-021) TaxID=946362 RepID=F2ULW6_SALR5|nr:uncharacterized protein PTSG_08993 [Salpingoeca rosetta]EGD78115.1 hypothetical protein PTSG_08993 [Salpingoeca rosetta]|eukprot:XP_004989791.1 hypothetical protein PTSG_08993 [Salpingoeca rosetta]
MGRRKSKQVAPKKRGGGRLPKIFACPFCKHEKSCHVEMLRSEGIGRISCKNCTEHFEVPINALSEPVDVFTEWIDECDRANKVHEQQEAARQQQQQQQQQQAQGTRRGQSGQHRSSSQVRSIHGLDDDDEEDDDFALPSALDREDSSYKQGSNGNAASRRFVGDDDSDDEADYNATNRLVSDNFRDDGSD